MLLPASAEDRRFLLAFAIALLVHVCLGALLSLLPRQLSAPPDERRLLQVTLTSAAGTGELLSAGRSEPAGANAPAAAPAAAPVAPSRTARTENSASEEVETPQVKPTPRENEIPREKPAPREAETTQAKAPPVEAPSDKAAPADGPTPHENTPGSSPRPERMRLGGAPRRAPSTGGGDGSSGGDRERGEGGVPTLKPRRYVPPEYPQVARHAGWSGTVVLSLTVGRRGRVNEVILLESSGHEPLDDAALQAAREWQFSPREAGSESLHRFEFRLE